MKYILALCMVAASLVGGESSLLERLEKSRSGDYIVFEANKTITLLAIRSKMDPCLILEEISAPSDTLKIRPASWADWVKQHAPGHTSWSMMEINLKDREILECYSFSKSAWIPHAAKDNLLATLLQLPLNPVQTTQRRRIGPPPQEGETDRRGIWSPPLMVDGKAFENALFDVFEAIWPQDGSEMGGKNVSLYFDRQNHSPLPYWIQVDTSHATATVRAIDSGKNLPALHRKFPRRIPQFIGAPVRTKNGVRLSIKSPKYYKEFELFAVDVTSKDKEIHPIIHSLTQGSDDTISFDIPSDELDQALQPDHKYTWLVVPAGHSESYIEFQKPFSWNSQ
jgi:hypothetical protein